MLNIDCVYNIGVSNITTVLFHNMSHFISRILANMCILTHFSVFDLLSAMILKRELSLAVCALGVTAQKAAVSVPLLN